MKKSFRFLILFSIALASFGFGAFLQKNHFFLFVKRVLRREPIYLAPPSQTILDWDHQEVQVINPRFVLEGLSIQEINRNRPLYLKELNRILGMRRFTDNFESKTKLLERVELKKVYREKWSIETEPDLWIPFYLFIPKNEKPEKIPLIFVLHGHGAGKIETAGLVPSYQKGNALILAEQGFATVAPDFRGFGELGWPGETMDALGHEYGKNIHIRDVLQNLKRGRTVLGSYLYDLHKIFGYMLSRPEIDPDRIGVTGTSMGADAAFWFALFEERIKTVVACHPQILELPYGPADLGFFHACIYTLPGIRIYFHLREIPLLLTGRPVRIDSNTSEQVVANKKRIEINYREAGQPEKISIQLHADGKDQSHPSETIAWFKQWL